MNSSTCTTLQDEVEDLARLTVEVRHDTHVGRVRSQNQDSAWSYSDGNAAILAVADGMGGHEGGRAASRAATGIVESAVTTGKGIACINMEQVFSSARDRVLDVAPDGGTTLVIATLTNGKVETWHVGDSRAYLFRDGGLIRLTRDHSWVESLVAKGKLTDEQAAHHPRRNVLTRAIGKGHDPTPDSGSVRIGAGDVILLCSDGLHGYVSEESICAILDTVQQPQQTCGALVQAALDAGAPDNVTVAIARIDSA